MPNPEETPALRIELDIREPVAKAIRTEVDAPSLFNGEEAKWVLREAQAFTSDPESVFSLYLQDPETWGGAYISGDELLRMLPCRPTHPWLSYALGGHTLGVLPRELFSKRLAVEAQPGERVLFTMGMPASGKTTLVKGGLGRHFFAVVDTPLANFDLARELLKATQDSGRQASFVHAWRPLAQAAAGMLDRAMPGHEERAVPLADMAEILVKGLDVFQRLADLNRHDGGTTLDAVRSRGGKRDWLCGSDATGFLAAQRKALLSVPGGVLGQLVPAWRNALAIKEAAGIPVPAILKAIAEDGVDPNGFQQATDLSERLILDYELAAPRANVKSIRDLPGWADAISSCLLGAESLECDLRKGGAAPS